MIIEIDKSSGCCFGVNTAIVSAEEELKKSNSLFCLGDIVHNNMELERLKSKGLIFINFEEYKKLKNTTVLIRAHSEPPLTYKIALENNITLIDASCPVVLRLHANIRKAYDEVKNKNGNLLIFGKKGHAEVVGLLGQTYNNAIVVSNVDDLESIDFSKDIYLFAQTTSDLKEYDRISNIIIQRMQNIDNNNAIFKVFNTICKLVANRSEELKLFASNYDVVLFVSDNKSSNGKYLFNICKSSNSNTFFVCSEENIKEEWLFSAKSIGICGATSTPLWLMEKIKSHLKSIYQ